MGFGFGFGLGADAGAGRYVVVLVLVTELRVAGTVVRGGLIVLGVLLEEDERVGAGAGAGAGAGTVLVFAATVELLLLDFLLPTLALPGRVLPLFTHSLR